MRYGAVDKLCVVVCVEEVMSVEQYRSDQISGACLGWRSSSQQGGSVGDVRRQRQGRRC